MVTLHMNGDVVTHPDHARNYGIRMQRYEAQNKCRYGVKIYQCEVARAYHSLQVTPHRSDVSHCPLHCEPSCPKRTLNKVNACKVKTYKMTSAHYRTLADRAAYLKENSKHNLLFVTLTFGNWKRKTITDDHANKCFSKFMENLKRNYNRGNYIAVREHGEKNSRRVHYHVIIDLPYHNFSVINNAWCNAISQFCDYSPNAFSTDKDARYIKSTVGAVRYICKYLSKCRSDGEYSRIIFCSRELTQAQLTCDFSGNDHKAILSQFGSVHIHKHNDFCWRYNISCPKGSTKAQKAKTLKAANAFYYTIVRNMFSIFDTYFDEFDGYHQRKSALYYIKHT